MGYICQRVTLFRHMPDCGTQHVNFHAATNGVFLMKILSAYPSKYLKASDIPDDREFRRRSMACKWRRWRRPGMIRRCCISLDRQKGLVLNKTNADAIATVLGDDTDEWHGAGNPPVFHHDIVWRADGALSASPCSASTTRASTSGTRTCPGTETPIASHSDAAAGDDEIPF